MKNASARHVRRFQGPLGAMTLAATTNGLAGVWFDGQRHQPDTSSWLLAPASDALLTTAETQLRDYFAGARRHFDLPLDLAAGTDFQRSVWQALLTVGGGTTTSYSEIARRIGKPLAMRAVGAAVGRNPLSIVVPCHRVIGAGGALTGYAGGIERKTALLALEASSHRDMMAA